MPFSGGAVSLWLATSGPQRRLQTDAGDGLSAALGATEPARVHACTAANDPRRSCPCSVASGVVPRMAGAVRGVVIAASGGTAGTAISLTRRVGTSPPRSRGPCAWR
jgi:hypothetical protein